ncbi:MAG: alcohol dehydrogenase catalytic domain-containing protein [Fidelibacterota bacterium]|nr:MAG: alcohol dehydrogenase catalytic domain-containing protein [Candidatus Neomarinimicrobiota bacterium]
MRQAVMTEPGKIELREVPKPSAGSGEVLLHIRRIGVCGSDIHVNHGLHPFTSYPVVQGHEFAAVVEDVGEGVEGVSAGMKVTARPQVVCGACAPCRRGDYHICDVLKVEGFQAPGVAQDYFTTSTDKLVPLPDSMTLEQGALVEPTSVAVHAANRAGDLEGKNVVVFGAGPIGNLIAQVAKSRGAGKVLIRDLSDYRLDIARQCGLEHISNARTEAMTDGKKRVFGDEGYSVAFEAAGVEATMADAVDTIEKGGTIMVVGVFGEKPRIDMAVVGDRELNLIGTLMYKHEDYEKAVELIARGEVITDPLVTKHFPLEEYEAAYAFIDKQGDKILKVMIDL